MSCCMTCSTRFSPNRFDKICAISSNCARHSPFGGASQQIRPGSVNASFHPASEVGSDAIAKSNHRGIFCRVNADLEQVVLILNRPRIPRCPFSPLCRFLSIPSAQTRFGGAPSFLLKWTMQVCWASSFLLSDDVADPVAAALLVFCRFPMDFLFLIQFPSAAFALPRCLASRPAVDPRCVGRVGSVLPGVSGRCGRSGL